MPMKREFVNVDTEAFSATVPSIGMLKAPVLFSVMLSASDSTKQFEIMVSEFRKNLTEERLAAFDELSMDDWISVIVRWMVVSSNEEDIANAEPQKKMWWKFW